MFGPLSFPSSFWGNEDSGDVKLSPCFLCDEKFDLCFDREEFMNHILESHSAIIKDCDCIIDLARYVDYWKEKFKFVSIKEICCPLESKDSETGIPCYILSDSIKEDKELREKLNKQALEKALERQKFEREDKHFKRRCLFCWHDIEPTRAVYLSHLSSSHNLQLGKPDNLVFIDKYLDVIEHKIENLKCIFCEKTFKDRNVLKEHMRKKLHKRVNPKNPIYDQFYMVNYLTPGISNKKLRERKRRKSFDDDDDDCDWSDWKEEATEPIVCLFCLESFHSWDSVLQHLMKDHSFDFKSLSSELNFYEQIKIVNYIRRQIYRNQCIICDVVLSDRNDLLSHMTKEKHFLKPPQEKWDQPEYFFPTYENDGFLYHLDDSSENMIDSDDEKGSGDNDPSSHLIPSRDKYLPCLFCDFTHQVGDNLLNHMYDVHKFDYNEYTRPLNFMDRVKLINYTKHQVENKLCIECDQKFDDLESLIQHMGEMNHFNTPPKSQWQHVRFSSNHESEDGKNVHEDTVDYLYALESLNNIKKDLDIEKEVKENCFSDCDEDAVPILCLFCNDEFSSWSQVISHLETSHKFSFIELTSSMSFYDQVKMITYLRKMIKKLTCPVCEEVCTKEELLKHLETKNHFTIPPKTLWDKSEYYPASFAGDPFLSELNVHHATDTLIKSPHHQPANEIDIAGDSNVKDEESGSDWGDWDEEMKIPVMCLLCKDVSENWVDVHNHMKSKHNFSYHEISTGLVFYDQVKLVNYLRSQVASKHCFVCDNPFDSDESLLEHYQAENHLQLPDKQLWNKDKFFQPFMENDGFLAHIDDGDSDDDI